MDEPAGQFRVVLTLYPRRGGAPRSVDALVDSGAGLLGCATRLAGGARLLLRGGNGSCWPTVEEWPLAHVEVQCGGRRATTPILMGPAAAPLLVGATVTADSTKTTPARPS